MDSQERSGTDCDADILLLTAVPDELEVVLALGDGWIPGKDGDGYPLHRRTDEKGRRWILARAIEMGGDAAANVATRLVAQYRPKCLAMVGVCAGWRGKIALGDVILAERVFRYDAGKLKVTTEEGKREEVFLADIKTHILTEKWKQYAEDLAREWGPSDWQFPKPVGYEFQEEWVLDTLLGIGDGDPAGILAHPERPQKCPDWSEVLGRLEKQGLISFTDRVALTAEGRQKAARNKFRYPDGFPQQRPSAKAHVAPIGSGTMVVEDPEVFDRIARSVRKVLGVEMEGSAVAGVASIAEVRHCLIVKGVSDHADHDKDDRFRSFAIEGAYRFLKALLDITFQPAPKKTPFILPHHDKEKFAGRTGELDQLKNSLLGGNGTDPESIAGISGAGGIGKSGLAAQFAILNRDHFPDGVICLRVDGKKPAELARSFARLVGVDIPIDDDRDAIEIMQEVFRNRESLLIFDNADNANVRELLPGGSCKVLVTTRDRALPGAIGVPKPARVDVPPLPLVDALAFLSAEHPDIIDRNREQAERLAGLVGCLPLALHVVSALIGMDDWRENVLDYLANELETERNRLNTLAIEDFDHLDVRASFNLSLNRMEEPEIALFASSSVCDPTGFSDMAATAASGEDEASVKNSLSRLRRLSMLNTVDGTTPARFVFHPLLLEFAKELADERDFASAAAKRHATFYMELFTSSHFDQDARSLIAAELGEAIAAANWAADNVFFHWEFLISLQAWLDRSGRWDEAIDLLQKYADWPENRLNDSFRLHVLNLLAKFLIRTGRFRSAIETLSRFSELPEADTSEEQRIQGAVLNTLGTALQKNGELEKAESILRRSLKLCQTVGDRRNIGRVLNSLGGVLQRRGKFEAAAASFNEALQLAEAVDDVRSHAMILNSLGGVLQRQGKFDEAVEAFERSLHLAEAMDDQRAIAMVLNSLGGVLQRQGKFDSAIAAFERSAGIEADFGIERGQAMVLNSLGGVFQRQGKFDAAAAAFERSLHLAESQDDVRGQAMILNSLGGALQRQGKFDEAVEAFERSLHLAGSLGDVRGQSMILNSLGGAFQRQGKFDEAVEAFERSLHLAESQDDVRGQAMILNSLGGALQRQGKFDEAVEAFKRSADIEESLGNERGQAMVLASLGSFFQRQGKFDDALAAFKRSADIEESLGNERGLAMVLNSLGGVLQHLGKMEDARAAFERSLAIAEATDDQRHIAMVLNSLGGVFQRLGKFDEAAVAFGRSLELSEASDDQQSIAIVLNSLGSFFQRQGKFESAVSAFERSLAIAEALDDRRHIAIVLNSLGGVLQRQGKLESAASALERSLELSEALDDRRNIAMVLNSLGGVLQRQGKLESAASALKRSLKLSEALGDSHSIAMVLNSLGGVLQRQDKLDEAVSAFERSLAISEDLDDRQSIGMVLNSLGGVLQRQRKFDEAVSAFDRSLELSEALGDSHSIAMVLNSLGGVLQRQGKFQDAVDIYERSYKLAVELGDDRGQAMVLNSLGGALERVERAEEAERAFLESIEIGQRLKDTSHLAKVHTAFGKALLYRKETTRAIEQLTKGFELDEASGNRRGIRIVVQSLVIALARSGRAEDVEGVIRRAIAVAPGDKKLQEMLDEALNRQVRPPVPTRKITGVVKRVLEPMGKSPFAFIVPDEAGKDIYVNERGVGAEAFAQLAPGQRVEAMVFENERGDVAASVVLMP